jgi:hypothetical protein
VTPSDAQFIRRAGLVVSAGTSGLDLSDFRFKFDVRNADVQSPNNASIRVYNLSTETVAQIRGEFQDVTLLAGYQDGAYGVIFSGSIKQFRVGKENATTTFLDILAADGDIGYNFGIVNTSLAAESTSPQERVDVVAGAMGMDLAQPLAGGTGGVLPRGKVLFGMARAKMAQQAANLGSSWSIQDGKIQILPFDGYLPGEAVVLNSLTGLVGIPEATDEGVRLRCLLNPRVRIGGLVQLNSREVNQTVQANPNAAPIAYNQYAGLQLLATVSPGDGFYRAYVVEHEGDTRGQEWYTTITCLAVDIANQSVITAPD